MKTVVRLLFLFIISSCGFQAKLESEIKATSQFNNDSSEFTLEGDAKSRGKSSGELEYEWTFHFEDGAGFITGPCIVDFTMASKPVNSYSSGPAGCNDYMPIGNGYSLSIAANPIKPVPIYLKYCLRAREPESKVIVNQTYCNHSGIKSGPITAPIITSHSNLEVSNQMAHTISGVCLADHIVTITGEIFSGSQSMTCTPGGTFSFNINLLIVDGIKSLKVNQKNSAGKESADEDLDLVFDTTPPNLVAGSMRINSDNATTVNNIVGVSFNAIDPLSNITHFCLKYQDSVQPTLLDSCWKPVDGPEPNIPASKNLSIPITYTRIGFTPGTYKVNVFIRDEAGNISVHNGADKQDEDEIDLFYNNAPEITNVLALANPADPNSRTIPAGSDVHIKWRATDVEGLSANPINLYYTTDSIHFLPIPGANNLVNGSNGCVIDDPGTSADDVATGCFLWNTGSPTSSYYKIRIEAVDNNLANASVFSEPVNASNFRVLAGNTDRGIGNAAVGAIFSYYVGGSDDIDISTMAVMPNGEIFIADNAEGLVRIDPISGKSEIYIANGVSNTNDGPIASATVRDIGRLFLDYQNRIILYDYDRIRRVDPIAGTITTIIGGGADSDPDGVSALSVNLPALSRSAFYLHRYMFALPDGRIIFKMDNNLGKLPSETPNFYYLDKTGTTVHKIAPSGVGSANHPTLDITSNDCNIEGAYLSHDLNTTDTSFTEFFLRYYQDDFSTSCNLGFNPGGVNLNPNSFVVEGPHPPNDMDSYYYKGYVHGMNGKIYAIDRHRKGGLFEWNSSTKDWDIIAGNNQRGTCVDGTAAMSCSMDIVDAFVSIDGYIYINDAGAIRTIDDNGDIRTLYGQKKDFGDGANATSARFENIQSFKVWDNAGTTTIVALDKVKKRFREFSIGGNINTIVGNGSDIAYTIGGSGSQSINDVEWGPFFEIHPTSGDIFFHNSREATMWDRSSDLWRLVYGQGATQGWNAVDGDAGSSISWHDLYPPRALAIDPVTRRVLYAENGYNGVTRRTENSFIFTMDFNAAYSSATYSYISGQVSDDNSGLGYTYCPDGTLASSCLLYAVGAADSDAVTWGSGIRAQFNANTNRWLLHDRRNQSRRIGSVTKGGNFSTLTTLDNDAINFEHFHNAGTDYVFYCGKDFNLYKRNVNTLTEYQVIPDTPGITCTGNDIHYDSARDTLMFIFLENGMTGIGEILNP